MKIFLKQEKGFTYIEILLATIFLSVTLIAILSMLFGSTKTSIISSAQTLASELANEHIEYIRSLAFKDIGTVGGNPEGVLNDEVIERSGVKFNVSYEVAWIDDPADNIGDDGEDIDTPQDYKRVIVTVSWTSPPPGSSVKVSTNIREKDSESRPPIIEFVAPTPNEFSTALITGGSVNVNTPVWETTTIAAQATDEDGVIDLMNFYIDNLSLASWSSIYEATVTKSVGWNTLNNQDGMREVKVEAFDNRGGRDYRVRYLVVDNQAPNAPTNLSAQATGPKTIILGWTPATDGTNSVPFYDIYRYKTGETPTKIARIFTTTSTYTDAAPTLKKGETYNYYFEALSPREAVFPGTGFKTASSVIQITL
ncbi:MAG: hypothetical protein Q8M92_03875 [Candidatus Subteraquimicrobiales bacterium]|nr:hypothetical protein [Candidatus Subteraquimicrobiales bacterium]